MQHYINSKNEVVTLTGKESTNSHGDKFLWVRCENGAVVSIPENDFAAQFDSVDK